VTVRRRRESSTGPLIVAALLVVSAGLLGGTWWYLRRGPVEREEPSLLMDETAIPFDEADVDDDAFVMILDVGEWQELETRMKALRTYIADDLKTTYPEAAARPLRVRLRLGEGADRAAFDHLDRLDRWAEEFHGSGIDLYLEHPGDLRKPQR